MAALDFPNAPTNGQQWVGTNGATYTWDGLTWNVSSVPGTSVAPIAPTAPVQGQLWWRNDPDGNLYISYNDGNSTQWVPAVPSSAPMWTVAGGALTPVDATKRLAVPGPTAAGADQSTLVLGAGTVKTRLNAFVGFDITQLTSNRYYDGSAYQRDNTSKTAWALSLDNVNDAWNVARSSAAGVSTTLFSQSGTGALVCNAPGGASLLTLDATGMLSVPSVRVFQTAFGPTAGTLSQTGSAGVRLDVNDGWAPQVTGTPSWELKLDAAADALQVYRRAAGAGAGAFTTLLNLDATGQLTLAGSSGGILKGVGSWFSGNGGVRCANVGTAAGDGYSNTVAFGWDGTLKCRIDSTVVGTVTLTSDRRLKLDVAEDVPGLDAVCALRPISFEYDQTKREIGFPKGRHYGLIAQDIQPHVPLAVGEDDSDEHWQEIDYRALVPVLINAIRELTTRVAQLEAR